MIRLLYVDDERMDFELSTANIKKYRNDIELEYVNSACDALELLKEGVFDCILSDYQMPQMDGLEFLKETRKMNLDIPFIFLTGQGNEKLAVETFRAGADDYYTKEEGFAHYERLTNSIIKHVDSRRQKEKLELAERNAKIHNEKFSVIFNSIDDAIFVHPFCKEGFEPFVEVNDIACKRYGYTRAEFLKLTAFDISMQSDVDVHKSKEFRSKLLKEKHLVFDSVHVKKNGEEFPVEINANIVMQSGKPVILAAVRDISKRRKAEGELRESKTYLTTLVETIPDMIWLKDKDGVYLSCNPRFESFVGKSSEEIIGGTDYDFFDRDLADFFRKHDKAAVLARGPLKNEEEVTFGSDGHKELLETLKTPMSDDEGQLIGVLGIARDVTDWKNAEAALKDSEAKQRGLSEASFEAVFLSENGICINQNKAAEVMFGYSNDEATGMPGTDRFAPEARQLITERILSDYKLPYESVGIRRNGEKFPVEIQGRMIDYQGRKVRVTAVRDISRRRRAEGESNQSRFFLKTLIQTIPDVIWLKDEDGVYISCNSRFEELIGRPEEEILGKTDYDFYDREWADTLRENDKIAIDAGKPSKNEEEVVFVSDGHKELLETLKTPMFNEDGKLIGVLGVARNISELNEERVQLEENKLWFEQLLMNLEDMVVKIDTDNRFTYVNESYCKTFGKSPDELIGKNFIPLVHEDDQESTLKAMAGLHKPPFKAYIEQRAMTADGWKWFAWVNTSILDEKNEVVEIIGVGRDISEIKKSQLVIEQSEARFRHLFEDFPISLWEEDGSELLDYVKGLRSQGIKDFASYFSNLPVDDILDIAKMLKVVNINKASISMYQAEEKNDLIGNLDKTFLPESLPVFIEEISCLASGQTSFSSEGVTQTLKGKKIDVHLHIAIAPGYEQTWEKMYVSLTDITERKNVEKELLKSESRMRALSEASFEAIFLSRDAICTDQNQTAEDMFGYPYSEANGKHGIHWIAPEERRKTLKHVSSGFLTPLETIGYRKDGSRFPIEIESKTIVFDDEKIRVTAARDISEKRMIESNLAASEKRFREIIEEVSEIAIQGYDTDRKVTFWNLASEQLYGYKSEEALGMKLEDLIIPDSMRESVIESHLKWVNDNIAIPAAEMVLQDKHGNEVPVFSCHVLHDSDGKKEMFCLDIDLKPIKKVENELRANREKLRTSYQELESFSRSVAHDLKAPLRHMKGFAELLQYKYSDCIDDQGQEYLNLICNSASDMTNLVNDILKLARASEGDLIFEKVDLCQLALDTFETLRKQDPSSQAIFECSKSLVVQGDKGLLLVVIVNLLGNALKFSSKNSNPKIVMGTKDIDCERVYFIQDNGVGFNPEYIDKLFIPFQRLHSKAKFPGTGLGLTIVRKIVERHGGRVWGKSEVGEGATFYFTLGE